MREINLTFTEKDNELYKKNLIRQGENNASILLCTVPDDMKGYDYKLVFKSHKGDVLTSSLINSGDVEFSFPVTSELTVTSGDLVIELQAIEYIVGGDYNIIKSKESRLTVYPSISYLKHDGSGGGGVTTDITVNNIPAINGNIALGAANIPYKNSNVHSALQSLEQGGGGGAAASTTYDNTNSGLESTDVQGAIDEVAGSSGGGTAASTTYDNANSGLESTDVQGAIDEIENHVNNASNNIGNLALLDTATKTNLVAAMNELSETVTTLDGVLTPEQFGAKGDGVTDDTAAIQAAFDAAYGYNAPNLAESLSSELGYLKPNGDIDESGDWYTFEPVIVTPGRFYTLKNVGSSAMAHILFYDTNGGITRAIMQNNYPERFLIAEDEVAMRFSSPESVGTPILIDSSAYGLPVHLGRRVYRTTDRLYVHEPITVQGASMHETLIFFDGDDEFDEEIPHDFENFVGSHSALCVRADACRFSGFSIFGYDPKTYAATRIHASKWNGVCMHFVSKEGNTFYNGTGRNSFDRVRIVGFEHGFFMFAGWNRYFVNCEVINCREAGISYNALELSTNWSCSGDIWLACQIIGCRAGAYMGKTFETTLHNCVFEYNVRAIEAYGCLDTVFMYCWNEANVDNLLIDSNATFLGGYNIAPHTIDNPNGYVSIEKPSEIIGMFRGNVVFHQKDGVIVKGVSLGSSQLNILENPSFGTIAVFETEPWAFEAYGVHTYIDNSKTLNHVNSLKLDSTDQSWGYDVMYGIVSPIMTVDKETEYKISFSLLTDGSKGQDRGVFFSVAGYTENDEYVMNIAGEGGIMLTANDTWEDYESTFTTGNFSRISIKIGMVRHGIFWISSPVLAMADITSDRVELRKGEGEIINVVDNLGNVIGTISMDPAE